MNTVSPAANTASVNACVVVRAVAGEFVAAAFKSVFRSFHRR